jgi:hypothetical protein
MAVREGVLGWPCPLDMSDSEECVFVPSWSRLSHACRPWFVTSDLARRTWVRTRTLLLLHYLRVHNMTCASMFIRPHDLSLIRGPTPPGHTQPTFHVQAWTTRAPSLRTGATSCKRFDPVDVRSKLHSRTHHWVRSLANVGINSVTDHCPLFQVNQACPSTQRGDDGRTIKTTMRRRSVTMIWSSSTLTPKGALYTCAVIQFVLAL